MEKEKELENVRKQIEELQNKEKTLVNDIFNNIEDFSEKFKFWMKNNLGVILGDVSVLREYPYLLNYLNNQDLRRYVTYDFVDYYIDDFGWLTEDFKGCEEGWYTEERKKELKNIAALMMDNNIRGVIWDW